MNAPLDPPSAEPGPAGVPASPAGPLRVIDLGRLGYAPALATQRRVNEAVIAGDEPATLLLVEHEPVITVSYRREAARHLIASRRRLAELGIDVQQTDRGGDITYHGPGQLVAYPILRLTPLGLNLSRYMRMLEQVVIDTLARFGLEGVRDPEATGVWVKEEGVRGVGCGVWGEDRSDAPMEQSPARGASDPEPHTPPPMKICAMGVRVRKNTTMHGLALNVSPDLTHFQTIVPCGLQDRGVTSLQQLLGERAPTMADVKTHLIAQMQRAVRERTGRSDDES